MRKSKYTDVLEQQVEEMWNIINDLLQTDRNKVDYIVYKNRFGQEIVVAGKYGRKRMKRRVVIGKNGIPKVVR